MKFLKKRESEHERSGYPHESEQEQQQGGNDASYSEQVDVTPPKPHEFPSVGNAQTDFKPSKPWPHNRQNDWWRTRYRKFISI